MNSFQMSSNSQQVQADPEIEERIKKIVDEFEDNFIFDSQYVQANEFLNQITDKTIREDIRILSIEARVLIYDDPLKSEQIYQALFEKHPTYFKNTFEYLTLLFDCYEGKAQEVKKKVLQIVQNYQGNQENDAYFLACKSVAMKSKKNMELSRKLMKQAIEKANKAYQISDMYAQLGNTYLELEQYQKAIKYYLEGLKIQPKNDECLNNISFCYLEMHELEKSIQFGELALLNYPYNSTVLCNLAIVYEELDDIDKAEQAYLALFQNKTSGCVQHANYMQFLYEHRFNDPNKRLLIIEHLKKGFIYEPTAQNSIFEPFYVFLKETEKFGKALYSYKIIVCFMDFLETIRQQAPNLLENIALKVNKIIQSLQQIEIDEEFEDISDDEYEYEDGYEVEEDYSSNQVQVQDSQDNQEVDQQQNLNIKTDGQFLENLILGNQIYQDPTLVKPISTHQQIAIYKLIYDMILLKSRENSILYSLIIYNRHISENLHFQSNIQFWDLYFD
ncbi:tetratricopeptide repeat protein (macronuclear) [Tetrahymena thermophila SB210]|uniref:Tetratricopeptide repeat protein n=1 Tax=Tetrahymena thermophila (strain SB210) TaxID=312017 RepID=I7LT26_TETTS|nr:tetratricopeptide repeat protein [Tetrahymena thermophila SB210]EAR84122.2 tetratricopeptide repeat protein [Tetrahymena thermophila SB210]|eukprot:XP_001031785.2 tetratricopeptide repeat protein [Tetrahymena thermophila SB210]